MKKITLIMMLLFAAKLAQAQTFSEWFRQKKTQKKYLIEQIAALKIYAGYAKKGYDIGKKGLNTIGRIKDGDFNLHRDFFGSLAAVNPSVKKYPRVADIITLQQSISDQQRQTIAHLERSQQCSTMELQYCKQVFSRLLADCDHQLEELINVTQSGALVMKDDERMQRIDNLYAAMLDNYQFCKEFSQGALELVIARDRQQREIEKSKIANGL